LVWTILEINMAKMGEKYIFKNRDWYYIVSMYKYFQLTLFQVLIGKFD